MNINSNLAIKEVERWRKTPKQILACNLMNNHQHTLLYGGSRSGKTVVEVRNMVLRGLKTSSTHLISRLHFNDTKRSIYYKTFPDVAKHYFPGVDFRWNKQDWFVSFDSQDGGTSQIWLGGISDEKRSEKVLGNEYSTIIANECSQIPYESIIVLRSRLAETSGLKLRFYYDLNPVGKKHWTYQEFIEGLIPGSKDKTPLDCASLVMNPDDNAENLPEEYITLLNSFPKRQRQRFRDGLYLSDVEGALWTDLEISAAKAKKPGEIVRTVIAIDPAVTANKNSDETGITVCSLDEFGDGVIEEDLSGKFKTHVWAQRAVNAYHRYEANEIIAETNNGGDLVVDAIKNIDPNISVVKVHASKGKFSRAEPVQAMYEQGRIAHIGDMPDMEAQMTEWVPFNTRESPDRLDSLVWGLTHLMLRNDNQIRVAVV